MFCIVTATFALADKKAEKARYTSDLSSTEVQTDAQLSETETQPETKRVPKRTRAFTPEPQCFKRIKTTSKSSECHPSASAALTNLPPVPTGLLSALGNVDTTGQGNGLEVGHVMDDGQPATTSHDSAAPAASASSTAAAAASSTYRTPTPPQSGESGQLEPSESFVADVSTVVSPQQQSGRLTYTNRDITTGTPGQHQAVRREPIRTEQRNISREHHAAGISFFQLTGDEFKQQWHTTTGESECRDGFDSPPMHCRVA